MTRKVTFVELPVFPGVVPLASGYLQAYCLKDFQLAQSFSFEKISRGVKSSYDEIISTLKRSDADIYAFSCYVWNAGLMRRLLQALLAAKPQAQFVLGGPQVMHQGHQYLSPEHENVYLCNGEGERTFANFLRALLAPEPDFSTIRNLSFYRNGQLLTTEPEPRIEDLSEIPSPFLSGLFEKEKYSWMLIETNRGCPFSCNYCYWGAATGARVHKYNEERIKEELAWICGSDCSYLFIADANWGMLKRDVELSRHIVEWHKRKGAPRAVYFCGSKNTPDRVAEISQIFHEAGLISSQSVALQTMNPETLVRVNRDNIKTAGYTQMQITLNKQKVASFVELIWPLPGETLASFEDGLAKLCEIGADSFVVYPLLLMNNVELRNKQKEYGLVTIPDPDPNSEAEIVVQSSEVDIESYRHGVRYTYAVLSLHVLRGLWHLGRYLNARGIMPYRKFFRSFVEFAHRQASHPWTLFCENSIRAFEHAMFSNTGALMHLILHSEREAFDTLLERFAMSHGFWRDPVAEFFFEVDLIHRPYIYRNTRIAAKRRRFAHLQVKQVLTNGYLVEIPPHLVEPLREYLNAEQASPASDRFEVIHRRSQLPFMPGKPLHDNLVYCQDTSHRMMTIVPVWREAARAVAVPSAVGQWA